MPFPIHPHMLRHACGFKLANDGHDTRALQHYLGHKNIQYTVRYTEMAPEVRSARDRSRCGRRTLCRFEKAPALEVTRGRPSGGEGSQSLPFRENSCLREALFPGEAVEATVQLKRRRTKLPR